MRIVLFASMVSILLVGCTSVAPVRYRYNPDSNFHNTVYRDMGKLMDDPVVAPDIFRRWRQDIHGEFRRKILLLHMPRIALYVPYEAFALVAYMKDEGIPFRPESNGVPIYWKDDHWDGVNRPYMSFFDWLDEIVPLPHKHLPYEEKWAIVYTHQIETRAEEDLDPEFIFLKVSITRLDYLEEMYGKDSTE
ncbi:hypothetical protein OAU50_07670 [Planctomycetota bacterium]|nr:hypothetical protein [Planctomycetota bacterium]